MNDLISWLLEGDVSLRYQTFKDILNEDKPELQNAIHNEGWGGQIMQLQKPDGHWGEGWYRPKWTCTHYTVLIFKYLQPIREIPSVQKIIAQGLELCTDGDGGLNFWGNSMKSDVCVNGMFLNYASYFLSPDERFHPLIDMLLKAWMKDGGWNCQFRNKVYHSSFHTTLSVLEGLWEYKINGGKYRIEEIELASQAAIEFLLIHNLYLSHRTKEIAHPNFTLFSYPPHWKFDVLKCLSHLAERKIPFSDALSPALDLLQSKRSIDGKWALQNRHAGKLHFQMEKPGSPSRWNTLRAMRVLNHFSD